MNKLPAYFLASALVIGISVTTAEATTKIIQFAKGKTSASVTGKIKGNEDIDYILRAGAGQTLTVDLKAGKGAAFFNVLPPGSTGEALFVGSMDADGKHFNGALPSNGDYIVRLYLMGGAKDSGKPVSYTLNVAITGNNSGASAASGTVVAEKACLAEVAKTVGLDSSKLKVLDVTEAQSGISVMVQVPEATAPWSCLSSKSGKVDGVSFTGSEGKL